MNNDPIYETLRQQVSSLEYQVQEIRSAIGGGIGSSGLRVRVDDLEHRQQEMTRLLDSVQRSSEMRDNEQRQRDEQRDAYQNRRDKRVNAVVAAVAATSISTLLGVILNLLAGGLGG